MERTKRFLKGYKKPEDVIFNPLNRSHCDLVRNHQRLPSWTELINIESYTDPMILKYEAMLKDGFNAHAEGDFKFQVNYPIDLKEVHAG